MRSLISAALILWAFPAAARIALGGPCDIANNHLDGTTKEFITDCDSFGCESGSSLAFGSRS
jgi:hypothetical protein